MIHLSLKLRKFAKLGQKDYKSQNWRVSPENSVSQKHQESCTLIVTVCARKLQTKTRKHSSVDMEKNDHKIPQINEEILALDSSASRRRINFY